MCARGGCCVLPWLLFPGRQSRSSRDGCMKLLGHSILENLVFLHYKSLWIKYDSFPFVCVHPFWCLRCLCFCWVMVVLFQVIEECYSGKTPGWVEVSQIFYLADSRRSFCWVSEMFMVIPTSAVLGRSTVCAASIDQYYTCWSARY